MKRGFYGDKHEVQLALESTAFPGDQDSGEWRSKQELQPGHNRELGWSGLALEEK